jgi:uncharacterized membrane protein
VQVSQFFASWHPALVHFPVALLLLSAVLECLAYVKRDKSLSGTAQMLLVLGTVGLMFSFITGIYAEVCAARAKIPQIPIGRHEAFATATSWIFIGLTTVRSYIKLEDRKAVAGYLVALLLGCTFLIITGWHGGQLVYHLAAGVHGVQPPQPPTPQDLANLTLQNSEDELAYSGMMHHIFGWMTLWLAGWLAYLYWELPGVDRVRAMGPVVLTAGGLFLMIFSDFNAWPLSNELPVTDPEVLFHKVLATIMIFFGIGLNLARRKEKKESASMQSHLVALLALIGGGMLFTHVHTGAPYSDTAVGVYVQHFTIGCLALLCGGIKMLEVRYPAHIRTWNMTWIILLVVVGFNLVTYREGFPWYMPRDFLNVPWDSTT